MLSDDFKKRIERFIPQDTIYIVDENGDLILRKPREGITTNICGDGGKKILISSNASIRRTGLDELLDAIISLKYEYHYTAPGISLHGFSTDPS